MTEQLIDLFNQLRDLDPVSLIEILNIDTDNLVDALCDYIEDHQEEITENL